ncbi:MAG: CSLREA domain-containing protein, partial [Myxococcota bacterium]|nr:CSLREA domain-containing protein [Myxococcota bacterium]
MRVTLTQSTFRRTILSIGLVASALAYAPHMATAATITVTTLEDEMDTDGNCSLREAIQAANTDSVVDTCAAGSGADTIQLPAGTITISLTNVSGNEASNQTGD